MNDLQQAKWLKQALSAALEELQKDWHEGQRTSLYVKALYRSVENTIVSAHCDANDLVDELEKKQRLASLTRVALDLGEPSAKNEIQSNDVCLKDGSWGKIPKLMN